MKGPYRKTIWTGNIKATEHYCITCQKFHRTHIHILGKEKCPNGN